MKLPNPDVMGWLRGLFSDVHLGDLHKNRLLPVAALLLAACVAIPFLLSKSAHSTPVAQAPNSTPPPTGAIPAISVQSTEPRSRLLGHARDPFNQLDIGTTTVSKTTSTSSSSTTSSGGSTSGGSSTASTSTGSSSSSGSATSTPPSTVIPPGSGKPAPPGLGATESYEVSFGVTNSSGGFNTVDPLERLSVIPSDQQPLLVELGVTQGGQRVMFAVLPGAVLDGPGSCTPGRIDCQILSLGQNQTEGLSMRTATGTVQVADFAITGISAHNDGSVAAANRMRGTESAAGRRLLDSSNLTALSLFQYSPSVGAVVDMRNLTVGGGS